MSIVFLFPEPNFKRFKQVYYFNRLHINGHYKDSNKTIRTRFFRTGLKRIHFLLAYFSQINIVIPFRLQGVTNQAEKATCSSKICCVF